MKIQITSEFAPSVIACLKEIGLEDVAKKISRNLDLYGQPDTVDFEASAVGADGLSALYQLAKNSGERSVMMQITSLRSIMDAPFTAKVGSLKALVPGLIEFFKSAVIDGWVYYKEKDGTYLPWLVKSISYETASQHSPARVRAMLIANVAEVGRNERDVGSASITIGSDDIVKKTIPEILADRGYFHETKELKNSYEQDLVTFGKWRTKFGHQFRGKGIGILQGDYKSKGIDLDRAVKMVNDEEVISRRITEGADNSFWQQEGVGDKFNLCPFHCRMYMFHLSLHEHVWVHVSQMEEYVYRPELKEKLILPDLHRDLIDILTNDMEIIQDDFVEGKSGGTTILCKGKPGLGKTLTAEVYSEIVRKPLYRVHSGQLGVDAVSVEGSLSDILKRAQRWGAILLLDEADVFVRARGDDINHNAVVGSFLRTLEYFSGLLFMTTNRSDDIDDAIVSRCIAVIKYEAPGHDDAKALWRVLSSQYEVELSEALILELVELFPSASGRDIKELLKLTSKFIRHKKIPTNAEAFRQCAVFRGII